MSTEFPHFACTPLYEYLDPSIFLKVQRDSRVVRAAAEVLRRSLNQAFSEHTAQQQGKSAPFPVEKRISIA